MNKTLITLSALGGIIILGVILLFSVIGNFNDYTKLENLAKATQTDNKNVLDNTRKSIREAANISDKEVEALTKIITGYAESRGPNTAGRGELVTVGMITEAVPSIQRIETLRNLQNILVAGRKDWQYAQTRLADVKRQGDDMLGVVPSGSILKLFGKKPIDIVIVTSTETEANFKTGKDDANWVD